MARRRWYIRVPLFEALQSFRRLLTSLLRPNPLKGLDWKPEKPPSIYLIPLDWRSPPTETIGGIALPLAATAATAAAEVYYFGISEKYEENSASEIESEEEASTDRSASKLFQIDGSAVESAPSSAAVGSSAESSLSDKAKVTSEASQDVPNASMRGVGGGGAFGDEDPFQAGARITPIPLDYTWNPPNLGGGGGPDLDLPGPGAQLGPTQSGPLDANDTSSYAPPPGSGGNSAKGGANVSTYATSASANALALGSNSASHPITPPVYSLDLSNQPVSFVANDGQWGSGIDFGVQRSGFQAWILPTGATFELAQAVDRAKSASQSIAYDQIGLNWVGIAPNLQGVGAGQLTSTSNYLLGNNPADWYSNVSEYSSVRYANAWPGIDLVYLRSSSGGLEYDFDLQPGADLSTVGFQIQGAQAKLVGGKLLLTAPGGATLIESAPTLYQIAADGRRQPVSGGYTIRADGTIGFTVGKYDPSDELVVDPGLGYDPVVFTASNATPLGITMDSSGDAISAGWTSSPTFPTTSGAYQTSLDGSEDAYIVDIGSTGTVLWSTYLGGSSSDQASGIALGSDGSIYVTGNTTSSDFPTTSGAYQTSLGGSTNAFLSRLSSDGSTLISSTYLGGSGNDYGTGVALNPTTGQAIVVGKTTSTNFPTTMAYQSSLTGSQDAFISEFNATISALAYSSYLGGSAATAATGVAVDSEGNAYMVGTTTSSDLPTVNAYDTALDGSANPFASAFDSDGNLLASTYLGTGTTANSVSVDSDGGVYVAGNASSSDFLVKFTNFATPPVYTQSLASSAYGVSVDSNGQTVTVGATSGDAVAMTLYSSDGTSANWTDSWGTLSTGYGVALDPMGDIAVVVGSGSSATVLKYLGVGAPAAPVITAVSPTSGYGVTTSNTPTLSGTAPEDSTVSIYRHGPADPYPELVGTTSASSSGTWSYSYPTALSDDTYAFTATATVSGQTSPSSTEFDVTVETAGPTIAISVAALSSPYDTVPEIVVTAADAVGFSSSPVVTLNLDPYDTGSFSALATATLVNGAAVFVSYPALTVETTVQFDAEVTNLAGTTSTSSPLSLYVQDPGFSIYNATAQWRSGYGGMAGWSSPLDAFVYSGNVTSSIPLNLSVSTIAASEQPQALVYNSQQAAPAPTVQAVVQSNNADGVPSAVLGKLTWDGTVGSTINYTISGLTSGGQWVFGAAPPSGQATGLHTYSLALWVQYPNTSLDALLSITGYTFVVNSSGSPYGAGWSFQTTDALVTIPSSSVPSEPGGVLREFGTGGWAFYANNGTGGYIDPPGDAAGSLVTVMGCGWQYTAADGSQESFNSSGQMTNWTAPSLTQVFTYSYDGAGAVTSVESPDGATATLTYSGSGLNAIQAPGNRTTTFAYSGSDLTQIVDAAGGLHTYSYSNHRLTSEKVGLVAETYAYDSIGLAVATTNGGNTTLLAPGLVDGIGVAGENKILGTYVLAQYSDPLANGTTFYYNDFGQEVEAIDPLGGIQTYQRNSNGNIISYDDADHHITTYTVDAAGQVTGETRENGSSSISASWVYGAADYSLTSYTDFDGNLWTYANDGYGELTSSTDPLHNHTTYAWPDGLLQSTTDPLGNVTTYEYNSNLQLIGTHISGHEQGTYSYDAAGNPTAVTDALGNVTTSTYDGLGRILTVKDPLANVTTSVYDGSGLLLSTTDPLNRTTSYGYDAAGDETLEIDAYGTSFARRTTYVYDSDDRLIATVNALGQRTTTIYAASRVGSTQEAVGTVDARGFRTTSTFDLAGQLLTTRNAKGDVTTYSYDLLGRLTSITDPLNGVKTTAYDANSNVTAQTDPNGNTTTFVYDRAGNETAVFDGETNHTTYVYDADDRVTAVTDPRTYTYRTFYDNQNRITETEDNLGVARYYAYDADNRVTTATDPRGNVTTTYYDLDSRVTKTVDPLGNATSTVYDGDGEKAVSVDPRGDRTTFSYDPLGRATSVQDALGNSTTSSYNAIGELVSSTDARGKTTTYAYDADGSLISATDPLHYITGYGYDALDNESWTVDPLGNRTTFTYDADSRQTSSQSPNQAASLTAYYPNGDVSTSTTPVGNASSYYYDADNRLTTVLDPLSDSTQYAYDQDSNLTTVTNPLGLPTTYAYDADDHLTAVTDALKNTTTLSYDANGNVTETEDALTNPSTVHFDADNRPTAVVDAYGSSTTYAYDAAGNLTSTTDPRHNSTNYAYNARNMQTSMTDATGQVWTTEYDADGNGTATSDPLSHTTTTGYDADEQPTVSVDPLGNRTTYSYDGDGRITTVLDPRGYGTTDVYNADGNLVKSTDALNRVTTYAYDADGNATGSTDPLGYKTKMYFDALDRLTSTVDPLNLRSTIAFDAAGNEISYQDPLNNVTTYAYDADNRLTSTSDPLHGVSATAYDAVGNITAVSDQNSHATAYAYDADNRATEVTDPRGNSTTTAYDAAGNATSVTAPLSRTTTYAYDAENRLTSTTNPKGNVTSSDYNQVGLITGTVDGRGAITSYSYDAAGNVTSVTDPLGHTTITSYDDDGNVTTVQDARGNTTKTYYDADDEPTTTVDPLNLSTTYAYDADGNVTATVDPLGYRTTTIYDADNRPTTIVDALGHRSTFAYDADGNLTASTDQNNHTTTSVYDADGNMTQSVDPLGYTTTTEYDEAGNVTSVTDQMSRTTTYAYDPNNDLTSTTDPDSGVSSILYDAAGEQTATIDPMGRTTTYAYDADGELTTTTQPGTRTKTDYYDANGNVTAVTDARSNTTTYAYDADNQLTASTDPLHATSYSAYDSNGNVTSVTDPLSRTTTYAYDVDNRLTATTDGLSHTSTLAYDADGNITAMTDALNRTTTYSYDALNRQTLTKDPLGYATTVSYDAVGNETAAIDASNNRTTWAYDADDRVTKETDPNTSTVTYAYDSDDEVTSMTDQDSRLTTYSYDGDGHLTGKSWFNSSRSSTGVQSWTYDADGEMLTAQAPAGTYTMTYDSDGEVSTVQEPFGLLLTFSYDPNGNRTLVQDSTGGTTTVSYDADNRQLSEQYGGTGISPVRYDYAYNAAGDDTSLTRYSNLAGTAVVGTMAYSYDGADRLTAETQTSSTGSVLASYAYSYNTANELTAKVDDGATTTYGYNLDGEITYDGGTAYTYDTTGNRTNSGYSTTTGNELTSDGTNSYTYDSAGNVVRQTQGSNGPTWVYTYNNDNELIGASYSATNGGTVTQMVTYSYDAFGNRTEEDVWNGSSTSITRFGVDGWSTSSPAPTGNENFNDWVDLNGSNSVVARRQFGTGFDQPVVTQNSSGAVSWYLADYEGSIRETINNSDSVLATSSYTANGVLTSGSTLSDRYGFQGMQSDSTLGLYYDNARMYVAKTGRFLSEDPLGFAGGSSNLYEYAGNRPTNGSDPSGYLATLGTSSSPGSSTGTVSPGGGGSNPGHGGNKGPNTGGGTAGAAGGTGVVGTGGVGTGGAVSGGGSVGGGINSGGGSVGPGGTGSSPLPVSTPPSTTSPAPVVPPVVPPVMTSPPPAWTSPVPPPGNDIPRGGHSLGNGDLYANNTHLFDNLSDIFLWGNLNYQKGSLSGISSGGGNSSFYSSNLEPGAAGEDQELTELGSFGGTAFPPITTPFPPPLSSGWGSGALYSGSFGKGNYGSNGVPWQVIDGNVDLADSLSQQAASSGATIRGYGSDYLEIVGTTVYWVVRSGSIYESDTKIVIGSLNTSGEIEINFGGTSGLISEARLRDFISGKNARWGNTLQERLGWIKYWLDSIQNTVLVRPPETGSQTGTLGAAPPHPVPPRPAAQAAPMFSDPALAELDRLASLGQLNAGSLGTFFNQSYSQAGSEAAGLIKQMFEEIGEKALYELLDRFAFGKIAELAGFLAGKGWRVVKDWRGRKQIVDRYGRVVDRQRLEEACAAFGGCLGADTPILTPFGSKLVQDFQPGDLVLTRDEHSSDLPVTLKVVEEVFKRAAKTLEVIVGERSFRTTSEHPFWVQGKGWVPAREIIAGDKLESLTNESVLVSRVFDTGAWETVYNMSVADSHTYFVGCDEWGFSVWAHNSGGGCRIEGLATLQRLGLKDVDLAGKSFGAGRKALEKAGFRLVETTETGRQVFRNAKTGAEVYYDSGKALVGAQKPHWHIRDSAGQGYDRGGRPVTSDAEAGHIPAG